MNEDVAARWLYNIVRQKRAAEFVEKVCFGDDGFTFDPDGTLVIIPIDQIREAVDHG